MRIDSRIVFIVCLCLMVVGIEVSVAYKIISPYVLSKPSQIVIRFWEMLKNENLFSHILITSWLSLLSALIGFIIGSLLALVMANLGRSQGYAEFLLDFVRSIPLTTLIPIFIAIYGIGESPKIAIGSVAAGLTTAITLYIGLKSVIKSKADFVYLYAPSLPKKIFKVYLHDSIPTIFTALRLSVSMALILVIVSEMFIGTEMGVGRLVMDKSYTDDRAGQYAAVLSIGIVGWVLNKSIMLIRLDKQEAKSLV